MAAIGSFQSRVILDSRGKQTIEVDVHCDDGTMGRASVPSGASTGIHEAARVEDMDQALKNVAQLGEQLVGQDPTQQERIDLALLTADGSEDKSKLGGNVLLAISIAVCDAGAKAAKKPLYQHIHDVAGQKAAIGLPTPMFNIINGGKHSDNKLEVQEFMVVPARDQRPYREKLIIGRELYQQLKQILHDMGHSTAVGDEGGFAPRLNSNIEAVELLVRLIESSSYRPQTDVSIAMDVAASSIPDLAAVTYPLDPISFYEKLITDYPIMSIEDPLTEDDWQGWVELNSRIGSRVMVVGDDLYTTNPKRLKEGIEKRASNAILIKPDQIGTLTETFQTMRLAEEAGFARIVSHRSGETESSFIADLAVGTGAEFLKDGAPARGERVAKYNQLLRIAEVLERA
ncbi:MAG: phosphopyruvate hydratase [Patescibacteria group bacterium]